MLQPTTHPPLPGTHIYTLPALSGNRQRGLPSDLPFPFLCVPIQQLQCFGGGSKSLIPLLLPSSAPHAAAPGAAQAAAALPAEHTAAAQAAPSWAAAAETAAAAEAAAG